jgi:DNA polymerase I-like protein with 3'-5' exonuclease and polymerase domains
MRKYFRYIADKCEEGGGQFDVQQHRSERIRGAVGFCDGCNTYFQGLSADGAKRALYEVAKECYNVPDSPLYGTRPVAFVHDEIIIEAKKEIAPFAAKRLTAIMVREMATFLPDIPIQADAALMNRWYKDAEPVYDEAGTLVCWSPE